MLEQTDFCIGTVLTPAGIGIVMRSNTTDCTGVTNLPVDAGSIADDGGLTGFAIVAPVPTLNQWSHISLDVKRSSDGSGVVGFDINYPGQVDPPPDSAGLPDRRLRRPSRLRPAWSAPRATSSWSSTT